VVLFLSTFFWGKRMSNRSWYFAAGGQQQGPYPEAQFRDLIARGQVTAQTLVWAEGMAGWQKAGEVPGLVAGGGGPPPMVPQGGAVMGAGGDEGAGHAGEPLSLVIELWGLLGRSILFVIGLLLVIPAPWVATNFYRWVVSRLVVPGRPNLAFTGQIGDIWWVFVLLGLCSYGSVTGYSSVPIALVVVQGFLSWVMVKWVASNISSNGQKLPISFAGSALGYVGWFLLLNISIITIIGWAWVITAWMRWCCRNISGTHREVTFNAPGLGVLWRTIVFAIACGFIIPIPWMLRWYTKWMVSQFALAEHGAVAA